MDLAEKRRIKKERKANNDRRRNDVGGGKKYGRNERKQKNGDIGGCLGRGIEVRGVEWRIARGRIGERDFLFASVQELKTSIWRENYDFLCKISLAGNGKMNRNAKKKIRLNDAKSNRGGK